MFEKFIWIKVGLFTIEPKKIYLNPSDDEIELQKGEKLYCSTTSNYNIRAWMI